MTPLNGMPSNFCVNMGSDFVESGLGALVDSVHRYGAKASIELGGLLFPQGLPPGKSVIE